MEARATSRDEVVPSVGGLADEEDVDAAHLLRWVHHGFYSAL